MDNNDIVLLLDNLKKSYGINIDIIEKIFDDFQNLGIEEFEYLRDLTEIVVGKKLSCTIKKSKKEKFYFDICEKEAIDYYANENWLFEKKYYSLVSNPGYSDIEEDDYSHDSLSHIKKC